MIKKLIIAFAMTVMFFAALPASARDAAVSRALTLPVRDALRVMDSLSRTQSVPGAARAESFRFLGDYQFARGDYKKAADFYKKATELDTLSLYKELHTVSITLAGGEAEAPVANQQPAAQPATVVNQPATPPAAPAVQPAPPAPTVNTTVFTVQIGAFGSKENADNLVNRLAGTYSDITISPAVSGDQTLFRVRIGSFERREDAAAFADKLITTSGLSARVVEK